MPTPIGTLGNVPSLTVGGRVFTDLTNLIVLTAAHSAGNLSTLRLPGASSGYQVPAGKTLKIWAIRQYTTSSYVAPTSLGYGDTDVGYNSGSTPTNPIYYSVGANAYTAGATTGITETSLLFSVPTGKYVFGSTSGQQGGTTVFGYLE